MTGLGYVVGGLAALVSAVLGFIYWYNNKARVMRRKLRRMLKKAPGRTLSLQDIKNSIGGNSPLNEEGRTRWLHTILQPIATKKVINGREHWMLDQ